VFSWKRTEILPIFLAGVIFLLTTWNAVNDERRAKQDRAANQQSRVVLQGINSLVSSILNAETGQRGYLLTRNPAYLEPYRTASDRIPAEMARLMSLLPPSQDKQRILELTSNKMAELGQTIHLSTRASFAAALELVMTDRGRQDMKSLRALADRMEKAEYAQIAQLSADSEERTSRSGLISFSGSALLLVLLVFAAVAIH